MNVTVKKLLRRFNLSVNLRALTSVGDIQIRGLPAISTVLPSLACEWISLRIHLNKAYFCDMQIMSRKMLMSYTNILLFISLGNLKNHITLKHRYFLYAVLLQVSS